MVEEFNFTSSTGTKVHAKKWYDENINKYKGIVQLVHGMEEFIDRYDNFAQYLAKQGYLVVGHDHVGHGKSIDDNNELGHIDCKDGWFKWTEDIHILQNKIRKEYPEIPYFILGHSMGSLLLRTYATIYKDDITGLIITGTSGKKNTMLKLGILFIDVIKLFRGNKYKSKFIEKMVTGAFNKKFKPNKTSADWLTRDEKAIEEYGKIMNPNSKFTLQSYKQMIKGSTYLNDMNNIKNTVNVPILVFSGDKDPVGEMGKGVTRVYNSLKNAGIRDIRFKLFKDCRHECLNELNRDEIYKFITDWMENYIEED